MRLLLRKLTTEVSEALKRIDALLRKLDLRVANLEQSPIEVDEDDLNGLVVTAVNAYIAANPPKNGENVTPEQVSKAVLSYFQANPIAISDLDYDQIAVAVNLRLAEIDYDKLISDIQKRIKVPKPEPVDYEQIYANIPPPLQGAPGVSIQKAQLIAGDLYLTFSDGRFERVGRVSGEDGKTLVTVKEIKADPAVGIKDVRREFDEILVELTNGEIKRFKFPTGTTQYVGGGYLSEKRVIELIQQVGGGGGESRQEVFLGVPSPLPNHPALVFEAVTVDGQTTYKMRFNNGIA